MLDLLHKAGSLAAPAPRVLMRWNYLKRDVEYCLSLAGTSSLWCFKAAKAGDLQVLQSKAHKVEGVLVGQLSFYAAQKGHLEVLQWLRRQGHALCYETCRQAAGGGHLAVLQWAREQGCHWDEDICEAAAGNGHLAVLRWARQHGCAWDEWTCEAAARGGSLAMLQFLHQNGCVWSPTGSMCEAAARRGHLGMLKWLRHHGCPWDSETTYMAAINNQLETLKWARQQQPPCPLWPRKDRPCARLDICPSVLVYLAQQHAPLCASHLAQARAAAKEMTSALLSLRAALPDRTPPEVVLNIVSLAFD